MNCHDKLLFLSQTSTATCVDVTNWSYNDDMDVKTIEDKTQPQGRDEGGKEREDGRIGVIHDDEMLSHLQHEILVSWAF